MKSNKSGDSSNIWLLIVGVMSAYCLLGPHNRLYGPLQNWLYSGRNSTVLMSAILGIMFPSAVIMCSRVLPSNYSAHESKVIRAAELLALLLLVSLLIHGFSSTALLYAVALEMGLFLFVACATRVRHSYHMATLMVLIAICLSAIAATNLVYHYTGWSISELVPHRSFRYNGHQRLNLWFGNPNDLGLCMAIASLLGLAISENCESRLRRILWLSVVITANSVLALTFSRGAWMALLAGYLTFLCARGLPTTKRWMRNTLICLVAALVLTSNIVDTAGRFASMGNVRQDRSISNRVGVWKFGGMLFADNFLVGVGLARFGIAVDNYLVPRGKFGWYATAVNNYVTLGAETGCFGLALFLYMLFSITRIGICKARASKDGSRNYRAALVAALVGSITYGMFSYNLTKLYYCIVWVFAGLIIGWGIESRCHDGRRGTKQ